MTGIPQPLLDIKRRLEEGKEVDSVTGRRVISWFNAERRTPWLINYISAVLSDLGLIVDPDLGGSNLDSELSFSFTPAVSDSACVEIPPTTSQVNGAPAHTKPLVQDATLRLRVLRAANTYPTVVAPDADLHVATTIMLSKDFSQIPVVQNRAVKGAISWKSIGKKLSLGVGSGLVATFLETPLEMRVDTPLIQAIPYIAAQDYALVNDDSGRLVGLVTSADLSLEFKSLSEPFLLLREVETYIRNILSARFPEDSAESLQDPNIKRKVRGVADLTLGEYLVALARIEVWSQIGIAVDRKSFVKTLEQVRTIRNDVMHFDPDPIQDSQMETLREFVRLLQAVGDSLRS